VGKKREDLDPEWFKKIEVPLKRVESIIENNKEARMNKTELINEVAGEVGLTKRVVARVINVTIEVIVDALFGDDKVTLVGFGTFRVRKRKARKGRNPQTGEELQILAKRVPKFVPGKRLREKIK